MTRTCTLAALLLAMATGTAVAAPPTAPDFTPMTETRDDVDEDTAASDGSRRIEPLNVVLFQLDEAMLAGADRTEVVAAARWLNAHPGRRLIIEGHTDALGPAAYNADLAARRANAVRDQLVLRGVDPDRLIVAVYGEQRAMASNPAA